MQIEKPICYNCIFLTPNFEGNFFCKAFPVPEQRSVEEIVERKKEGIYLDPKGIPDEIIFGENNHSTVIEGQVGDFVFTEGKPENLKKRASVKK